VLYCCKKRIQRSSRKSIPTIYDLFPEFFKERTSCGGKRSPDLTREGYKRKVYAQRSTVGGAPSCYDTMNTDDCYMTIDDRRETQGFSESSFSSTLLFPSETSLFDREVSVIAIPKGLRATSVSPSSRSKRTSPSDTSIAITKRIRTTSGSPQRSKRSSTGDTNIVIPKRLRATSGFPSRSKRTSPKDNSLLHAPQKKNARSEKNSVALAKLKSRCSSQKEEERINKITARLGSDEPELPQKSCSV